MPSSEKNLITCCCSRSMIFTLFVRWAHFFPLNSPGDQFRRLSFLHTKIMGVMIIFISRISWTASHGSRVQVNIEYAVCYWQWMEKEEQRFIVRYFERKGWGSAKVPERLMITLGNDTYRLFQIKIWLHKFRNSTGRPAPCAVSTPLSGIMQNK
jgi:hypothetical protein